MSSFSVCEQEAYNQAFSCDLGQISGTTRRTRSAQQAAQMKVNVVVLLQYAHSAGCP
jgi:hypothetical protein